MKKEIPKTTELPVTDKQIIALLFAISAVANDLATKLIKRSGQEKQVSI